MADEDDESETAGLYEKGYWVWNEAENGLEFVSTVIPASREETKPAILLVKTGTLEFKDGIDIIEQMRFRKFYRRKVAFGDPDVVTIQDLKDIAIYTAPTNFLTPMLINFLHQPATDRFLRALIFYCQYYLQVTSEMIDRLKELQHKIRTPHGDYKEGELRKNLNDFRLLVAKEYCLMIYGADGYRCYHHMGSDKTTRTMSFRDCHLYETFIRMCIQIAWIGLDRKSFNRLELEINRLFKSDTFNSAQHLLHIDYNKTMSKEERDVLFGPCVQKIRKLNTRSPLVNEVFCPRPIDFRLIALGQIKQNNLPPRLLYLADMIVCPEENLETSGVVCGILGQQRNNFDIMLRPVQMPTGVSSTDVSSIRSQRSVSSKMSRVSKKSAASISNRGSQILKRTREEALEKIVLPIDYEEDRIDMRAFPDVPIRTGIHPSSKAQRLRWLDRIQRLRNRKEEK